MTCPYINECPRKLGIFCFKMYCATDESFEGCKYYQEYEKYKDEQKTPYEWYCELYGEEPPE